MTITIPDALIDLIVRPGGCSLCVDIDQHTDGSWRLVVVEVGPSPVNDTMEIVDGYGITLEEAHQSLRTNIEKWLEEATA